jgi:ferritin-like metal-binding protein YciE
MGHADVQKSPVLLTAPPLGHKGDIPMTIDTLQDLMVHELRDLYSAEKQITKALPKLIKQVGNASLRAALTSHLEETKTQVTRLEEAFDLIGVSSRGPTCKGMEGILEEGSEAVEKIEDPDVRDAAIISGAQRVEHYEMSSYGTARAFAEKLGLDEIASLLTETLEEEATANEKLTSIAESDVNEEAMSEEDDDTAGTRSDAATAGARRRG